MLTNRALQFKDLLRYIMAIGDAGAIEGKVLTFQTLVGTFTPTARLVALIRTYKTL